MPIIKRQFIVGNQVKNTVLPQIPELPAPRVFDFGDELEGVADLENVIIGQRIVPANSTSAGS